MAITTILNCRVAGAPNYYPAYMPQNGQKPVRQRCEVAVYENDGEKTNTFRVTAFGKMADIMARSCGTGKQLALTLKTHTYDGRVALPGGQPGQAPNFVLGNDGQPITIKKTGHIVMDIAFGPDSEKLETSEIQAGLRPPMWNVKGHEHNKIWKDICGQRNNTEFRPGMTTFGYANVLKPNGQVMTSQQVQQYAGNPQAVGQGFGNAQTPQNGWGNQGGGNPVYIHGQNVGYAMNQNSAPQQSGWNNQNAAPTHQNNGWNQQGGYQNAPNPAVAPQQSGYNQNMGYAPAGSPNQGSAVTM